MNNPYAEHVTQQRVIALFRDELGYSYLGDWQRREGNAPVEESLLLPFLVEQGYSPAHAKAAVDMLRQETLLAGRSLYAASEAVYPCCATAFPCRWRRVKTTRPCSASTGSSRKRTTSPLPKR